MKIRYRYVFIQFTCFFAKNLPKFIFEAEQKARDVGEEVYESPVVEFKMIQKVGFGKYLTVWKVLEYRNETKIKGDRGVWRFIKG